MSQEENKSEQQEPKKIALNDNGGCPKGYTLINGECVEDITPPPPSINQDNED